MTARDKAMICQVLGISSDQAEALIAAASQAGCRDVKKVIREAVFEELARNPDLLSHHSIRAFLDRLS